MLGAIIGDVVGSIYEVKEVEAIKKNEDKKRDYESRIEILDKKTPLFSSECSYTDDTVLTVALMDAILGNGNYEFYLRKYGEQERNLGLDKYGRSRFGKGFISWLDGQSDGKSIGNGASMRVSSIGYYFDTIEEVLEEARKATIPSHNSKEAIDAASSVALAIFLARTNHTKEEIKRVIESNFGYDLNYDLETLQRENRFYSTSAKSVPLAIYAFLISDSFEDTLRKSLSIGGDADTIAAIACSIAESYYGIPDEIKEEVMKFIPENFIKVINRFYYELEFKDALKKLGLYDKDFLNFLKPRIHKVTNDTVGYAVFPKTDDKDVLISFSMLVPFIEDDKTLLINIHEYTHAYRLYSRIGKPYELEGKLEEQIACENEKLYLKLRSENNGKRKNSNK